MIRDTLSNLGGVGVYGVASISLFFGVFLGLLIWALRLKKSWLNSMSRLPLEKEDERPCDATHAPQSRCDYD